MKPTTMNDNHPSPVDSLDRRSFLTKGLAVSAVVTAAGTWSATAAPARIPLVREFGPDPRATLVISVETGEVFNTVIVPGSVVETQDPKLGRILRMEVILDGFGKPDISVSEQADTIEKFSQVHQELHRPPTCLLKWGPGPGFKLNTSVLSATTGFSLYTREGTPLRAHVLLDFLVLR
jgi:hypothetical protein